MVSLRLKVLGALVFQTTLQALLIGYSKNVLNERYNSAVIIFFIESLKVVASFYLMRRHGKEKNDPVYLVKHSLPMSVPAVIYFLQNTLIYVALSHVEPQVYSTLIQLKLLTAAIVSGFLLGRVYSLRKWRALFVLTLGAILVQGKSIACPASPPDTAKDGMVKFPLFGAAITLIVSGLSSLAGVYTEKVLSSKAGPNMWARNFQLALYSMGFALIKLIIIDQTPITQWFDGISSFAILIVCAEACRGLTVALVLKHADSILKGFATSCSIIFTAVLGSFLFGHSVDLMFILGAVNVITSIFMYNE